MIKKILIGLVVLVLAGPAYLLLSGTISWTSIPMIFNTISGSGIDAPSDAHLWASNYDRELTDVFAVQSEVAKAITNSTLLAFPELGMEAIYEFEIKDMPVTVAVDATGESVHTRGPQIWSQEIAQRIEVQE